MKFREPPVIEAIFQLQYDAKFWDLAIPGLLYKSAIGQEYPIRQDLKDLKLDVKPEEGTYEAKEMPRIGLETEDKKARIQVGPGFLMLHRLKPYDSWAAFRSRILDATKAFIPLLQAREPPSFASSLRYINRLGGIKSSRDLQRFLKVGPRLPESMSNGLSPYFLHVAIDRPKRKSVLTIDTGTVGKTDSMVVMLDVRIATTENSLRKVSEVESWIEDAHSALEQVFDECTTDEAKSSFQPVPDND